MFDALAVKHGHYCPMSTLGLRIGWAAWRKLQAGSCELTYLTRTCAIDGIQLVFNHEPLQIEEQGRHLLCVTDAGSCWQIELRPATLNLAASYQQLTRSDEAEKLLKELRYADEDRLLKIEKVEALQ